MSDADLTASRRFVDFRFEVKCRCCRCGDEKIAGCRGQFLFRNEFVNGIFDNFLISRM